ncbi:MAG: class I SAM-dependent methyltransferase [Bdellovibrionota bacterium]
MVINCLLCKGADVKIFWEQAGKINWEKYAKPHPADKVLRFFKCPTCELVFKNPDVFPEPAEEESVYKHHQNDPKETGYRNFLLQLLNPIVEKVKGNNAIGLDYGSGPFPSNAEILKDFGIQCESFDPFFKNDPDLLLKKYDFITCSEVVEHFYHPAEEFEKLSKLILPNGWLGIMTQSPPEDFANWWYHRDPTHVVFYSKNTFLWISANFGFKVHFVSESVTLLQKN